MLPGRFHSYAVRGKRKKEKKQTSHPMTFKQSQLSSLTQIPVFPGAFGGTMPKHWFILPTKKEKKMDIFTFYLNYAFIWTTIHPTPLLSFYTNNHDYCLAVHNDVLTTGTAQLLGHIHQLPAKNLQAVFSFSSKCYLNVCLWNELLCLRNWTRGTLKRELKRLKKKKKKRLTTKISTY